MSIAPNLGQLCRQFSGSLVHGHYNNVLILLQKLVSRMDTASRQTFVYTCTCIQILNHATGLLCLLDS